MRRPTQVFVLGLVGLLGFACSSSSPTASGGDGGPSGDSATSNGDGGTSTGNDAAPTPADAKSCNDYCALLVTNCTGKNEQYNDIECQGVCIENSKWNAGTPGDTTGNTLACRVTHAKAAATDQAANCFIAGKSGGGVCGSLCENFCRLSAKNCTGANQIYKDDAACMSTCGAWNAEKADCLIYHLNAASEDPATHCPHAAADSQACG
jgi:hypothetical protein